MDITKHDWKLFQERLPKWQENHMDRLNREYIELLSSDKPASVKYWELEKRINRDKKKAGVQLYLCKKETPFHLAELIAEGAITIEDLDGFNEDLIHKVKSLVNDE